MPSSRTLREYFCLASLKARCMSNAEICWAVGTFFRISSKVNGWPTGELKSTVQINQPRFIRFHFVHRFQFNYQRQDYKFTTNFRISMISLTRVPDPKLIITDPDPRIVEPKPFLKVNMATHQWDTTQRVYRTLRPDGFKSRKRKIYSMKINSKGKKFKNCSLFKALPVFYYRKTYALICN